MWVVNNAELTSLYGIPVITCGEECLGRPRCMLAVYHVLARWCILYQNRVPAADMHVLTGTITITRSTPTVSEVQCGTAQCNIMETCTGDSNGRRCKIKECGKPDNPMYTSLIHFGNMYDVGSRMVLSNGCQRLTVICNPNGHWSHLEYKYKPGMHDCRDIATDIGNDAQEEAITFPIFFVQSSTFIYCDFVTDGGDWLVFQRRIDGSEDFYRNWTDYTIGFGHPTGEFWLGLERLHNIAMANTEGYEYDLRIDMEDFEGEKRFAEYSTFFVGNASDNYRLRVGGYTGDDSGDSFLMHDGFPFSTYDRDNDRAQYNCAVTYTGAWWYNDCHTSNLNGAYQPGGNATKFAVTIIWKTWRGYWYSLKKIEMKLRRKVNKE